VTHIPPVSEDKADKYPGSRHLIWSLVEFCPLLYPRSNYWLSSAHNKKHGNKSVIWKWIQYNEYNSKIIAIHQGQKMARKVHHTDIW